MYNAMRAAGSGKVENADEEGTHRTRTKGILRQPSQPVETGQEEEERPSDDLDMSRDLPMDSIDDDIDIPQMAEMPDSTDFHLEVDSDHDNDMNTMMDVLQCLGVEPEVANVFTVQAIKATPTFVEVYGGGSIGTAAARRRDLNLQGLDAFDLRTRKPNG